MTIKRVLVAGSGLGACRVIRSLRKLGLHTVAVFAEADRSAPHVLAANQAICIGGQSALQDPLRAEAILDAARISGADAIHPSDDSLSSNADFAAAVPRMHYTFIGPGPSHIRTFADRRSLDSLASRLGTRHLGLRSSLMKSRPLRRVAVSIFGNGRGEVIALGERECTLFARGTCLLGESPVAAVDPELVRALRDVAVNVAQALDYLSLGSIEFLCHEREGEFFIAAAQPRMTTEDGVIEARMGIDWVQWAVRVAEGTALHMPRTDRPPFDCAIQAQLQAMDPVRAFRPSGGLVTSLVLPLGCHTDTVLQCGLQIRDDQPPTVAVITAKGESRGAALRALTTALRTFRVDGIETNLDLLRACVSEPALLGGEVSASTLQRVASRSNTIEVVSPGTLSIVVDYPGRLGYWHVGIPASGPMDDLSHRLANRIVGNMSAAASLEMTLAGPSLQFFSDAVVAITGARMSAVLDDQTVDYYRPVSIRAGQVLRLGAIEGPGARTYLAVRGGIDVPQYLASRTTFTLGGFGGHCGRSLCRGDVLHIASAAEADEPAPMKQAMVVNSGAVWRLGVLYGPHAAPEFFTPKDIEVLFESEYTVHFNSNRTGIRLIGPRPQWARTDGGEAGLHPSNIHDVPYAPGTIDFTGDMPILLGPDGPSLGGFVCPATVIAAERWKLGQLRPGDRVRFVPVSERQALELAQSREALVQDLTCFEHPQLEPVAPARAVLAQGDSAPDSCAIVYRRAGDEHLLVEYGPMVLDFRLRLRAHALSNWLARAKLAGVIDLTPGIRSLQIHYDHNQLSEGKLLDILRHADHELREKPLDEVPSRIVHLPLSWDDPQTRIAIAKYTQSVRPDAPWCPSNIEFIRRINGLASEREVYDAVFAANYLVLGLGDVYLGAPVATPIDPRHRLVTTKYNPARTWTPENAVGIGGAYLCIYGMEGPGGYQFVGRTLQVYNRFRTTQVFAQGRPWLLENFDQLRFFPVSAEELLDMRRDFPYGKYEIKIETSQFRVSEHQRFLHENARSIEVFKTKQRAAFEAERQRWLDSGPKRTTRVPGDQSARKGVDAGR